MTRPWSLQRLRTALGAEGRRAAPLSPSAEPRDDSTPADAKILERTQPYTMTSPARQLALVESVRYATRRGIPGALVECGVWRGGSVMAMLLALLDEGVNDREVYLFDTFEGMTEPGEADTSPFQGPAREAWEQASQRGGPAWPEMFSPEMVNLEAVRANVATCGYPPERVHFVSGPVEQTLPDRAPEQIAVLRLDTDWYESTRHELAHLYPRLADAGVLIIDDYGHWEGCRRAVDEYLGGIERAPLLQRIDYTGRLAIKA